MPLSQADTVNATQKRRTLTPKGLTESQRFDFIARPADDGSGCILWTGSTTPAGYGMFHATLEVLAAHRYAYRRAHGRNSLTPGLEIDHLCHQPACVNPDHLELVTRSENMRRQRRALAPTCINGHPRTPASTYTRTDRPGGGCRECRNAARQRYLDKVRADQPTVRWSYAPAVVEVLRETGPTRVAALCTRLQQAGITVAPAALRASLSQMLGKVPPPIVRIAPGLFALPSQIGGAA